jgi:anaerobic ribonucleoside-triphosphate reductase activating protein
MRIKRLCYPITALGPGQRVGIWVTGCLQACPGCISPELKSLEAGNDVSVAEIVRMISKIEKPLSGFTISGGEPFLQAAELRELVTEISQKFSEDIIVFSGYSIEELQSRDEEAVNDILATIAVLIDGPYIDELNDGIGIRGSSNQRVHIFKNEEYYRDLATQKRTIQSFRYQNQILLIGIQ